MDFKLLRLFTFCLMIVLGTYLPAQNTHEELFIELLEASQAYDIAGGNCMPGDIIITVKSNVPGLFFDSNVIDITQPIYDTDKQEYVFCHSNQSFILSVSAVGYIAKDIYIDGTQPKYGYKIVSEIPKGKIRINTTPKNAFVDFGLSGIAPQLTDGKVLELNAGKYVATITKNGYASETRELTIPSDGTIPQLDIVLQPVFGRIKLDITTADKSRFIVLPVLDIDTANVNLSDLSDVTKVRSFDSPDSLRFFKLYSGGVIPVPQGNHNVIINAPGYKTFTTLLSTANGSTTPLTVKMEPVSGTITLIDQKDALGADVFLDDELIGKMPLFKFKTKVGAHKISIKKEGYVSDKDEYRVVVEEDENSDLSISMSLFKQHFVVSEPIGAELIVNTLRQGFTPDTITLKEGLNEIVVRKSGYLDHVFYKIVNDSISMKLDTLSIALELNHPLFVNSEMEVQYKILKDGRVIAEGVTPNDAEIPFGKYDLELLYKGKKGFSGKIRHNGKTKVNAPFYSRGTFTTLVGDYYLQSVPLTSQMKNKQTEIYNLFAKGQFGRFNLLPGLSTSLVNMSVYNVNPDLKGTKIFDESGEAKYTINNDYILSASVLFLNGEFRLGGSIFKRLDINLLGTCAWQPDIRELVGVNHVSGFDYFYGIEFSTRISYLNVNIKAGKQVYNGNYNFFTERQGNSTESSYYTSIPVTLDGAVISVGFTLGQKSAKGNNMLRLWKKPLITNY